MKDIHKLLETDRNYKICLILLFVLFILLRSYHITSPMLDRHSWNQISTAASAMNIYKDPSTFWTPDFNAIQERSGSSVMAQEFPVFMGLIALGYALFGTSIVVARLVAIGIALIGWVYLFKICRIAESRVVSLLILFFYTINSHNWFFDRAINSDTGMVSFMLVALYYFHQYLQSRSYRHFIALTLATTLAGLFKPFGLMIGISFLYLLWKRKQLVELKNPMIWLMGGFAWAVNLSWLVYSKEVLSNSIGLGHRLGFDLDTLFSLKYPYILSQRFFDQILTPFLALFFIYALFSRKIKNEFASALFAGNLFYLIYITHGNLVHNYYQLPLTPALCMFAGLGFYQWLTVTLKQKSKRLKIGLAVIIILGFMLYSGKRAWNHFRLSMGPKLVGDAVKSLSLPDDTLMLAIETSGTRYHEILYYSELKGYVARSVPGTHFEKYRKKGVSIVAVHLEEEEFTDPGYMEPLEKNLNKVWSSYDCTDSYSEPCYVAIYRFK